MNKKEMELKIEQSARLERSIDKLGNKIYTALREQVGNVIQQKGDGIQSMLAILNNKINALVHVTKEAKDPVPAHLIEGDQVVIQDDSMIRVGTVKIFPNGELYVYIEKGR